MGILGKKKTDKPASAEKGKDEVDKKPAAVKKADAKKPEKKSAGTDDASQKREVELKNAPFYAVVRTPVSTEKAERGQAAGQYTFYVAQGANKTRVAEAIKVLYGVSPVAVRIINSKGKKVRYGRSTGRRKDRKKAIVTLKPGDAITVMD